MVHFLIAHVTVLLIVAFFILFAASKADGIVSLFGNVLGVWVVLVAILHVVAFFMPGMLGMKGHEHGEHGGMMHEHWMHHWGEGASGAQPAAVPVTPAPATTPAKPAPAQPAPAPKKS